MTDLEMTKLCAEAMGLRYHIGNIGDGEVWVRCQQSNPPAMFSYRYAPIYDDTQVMALIKKFRLCVDDCDGNDWMVTDPKNLKLGIFWKNEDLNRAVVRCVSSIQSEGK